MLQFRTGVFTAVSGYLTVHFGIVGRDMAIEIVFLVNVLLLPRKENLGDFF